MKYILYRKITYVRVFLTYCPICLEIKLTLIMHVIIYLRSKIRHRNIKNKVASITYLSIYPNNFKSLITYYTKKIKILVLKRYV